MAALHHEQPRHVTVVGGGFIGLEMMEALHQRMLHPGRTGRNPACDLPQLIVDDDAVQPPGARPREQLVGDGGDEIVAGIADRLVNDAAALAAAGQRPIPAVLSPHRGDPT